MRPPPRPDAVPAPEAESKERPATDADRRLDALEAKMDRLLESLEHLKSEKKQDKDDD